MVRREYEDDEGRFQVGEGPSPFAQSMQAQPWLRGGLTPWHMWGNSIDVPVNASFGGVFDAPVATGQLLKVAYKRPESWHWVFEARFVSVSRANAVAETSNLAIEWDVILGHGRSQTKLAAFDRWQWLWGDTGGVQNAPVGTVMWATQTLTAPLGYRFNGTTNSYEPDPTTARVVTQIVAEDIQVNARLIFQTSGAAMSAVIGISGYIAPKTHIRPDWSQMRVAPESQFPGGEVAGR